MNKSFTHIAIVLDRSGSMAQVQTATINGFNEFINGQKNVPGKCTVTLTQFDSQGIDTIYNGVEVYKVVPLDNTTFVPRGGTPLYDAIAKSILTTGKYLEKMPMQERPEKVVFVIITDGEENSSREFTQQQVLNTIKHQTDVYKWEFVFIGANINAEVVGQSMGISAANSMTNAFNDKGTNAMYAATGSNLRRYRSGDAQTMSFSAEQKAEQTDAADQPS